MSKTDYIIEMQDAFGQEGDPKELLKVAKKIKSLQKSALPKSKFVKDLSMRLEATHELDISEDIEPRFSVFQIFGALCSFVFISGALLSVYTMRSESESIIPLPKTGTTNYIQNVGETANGLKEEGFQETETLPIDRSQDDGNIEIIEKSLIPENKVGGEDIIQGELNDVDSQNQGNTETHNADINASSFSQDTILEDTESQENIQGEDSRGIYEFLLSEFLRICEENAGTVSIDEYECMLPNGGICNQDNIFSNSPEPCEALYGTGNADINKSNEIDLDVGELIESYGQ